MTNMKQDVQSTFKRLYVKYGDTRSIVKTVLAVGIFCVVCVSLSDNELRLKNSFSFSFGEELGLHEEADYVGADYIQSTGCQSGNLCKSIKNVSIKKVHKNKLKPKKQKKNPNKWVSKFDFRKSEAKNKNKDSSLGLPQRVIDGSKPINSIYKPDEIVNKNKTWVRLIQILH